MSILIKGMEMPTRCEDCFCFRHNAEYDYAYCNISSVNVLGHGNARLNNCPLVPVQPHGRLIDADSLAQDLEYDIELDSRMLDDMDLVGKEREHIQFDKDCKQNCMWYLTETPTVIEAEG